MTWLRWSFIAISPKNASSFTTEVLRQKVLPAPAETSCAFDLESASSEAVCEECV